VAAYAQSTLHVRRLSGEDPARFASGRHLFIGRFLDVIEHQIVPLSRSG
jgi:hypothetical protein